jgi:putative glutamine amidotransferase
MRRPVIGISGPDDGGFAAWFFAACAVWFAGGHPVRITPRRAGRMPAIDGLVLGGGADVDPAVYRQERLTREQKKDLVRGRSKWRWLLSALVAPVIYVVRRLASAPHGGIDSPRDELEWRLLEHTHRHDLPVLGICRGAQLMNVFVGGTLHQDLQSFYVEASNPWTVLPRKRISVVPGTRLARWLECRTCSVNSLHRQAVDMLGPGLVVSAKEPTGVIQAIEALDREFFVGVQWHPEYLPQRREQRRLFQQLVSAARTSQEASRERTLGEQSAQGVEQPQGG